MIYVYQCQDCGSRFQTKYRLGQHPETTECPSCEGISRRFMGRAGVTSHVHFVGWDWACKDLLDPESDDPRLDPAYFDDLLEDTDRGPKTFYTSQSNRKEA